MAISLYRKYRPVTFADVVGQEHVENTLTNAVAHDDVAHAYLFCGPRGTGKTTSARLLAKALLCENGPTPNPDGSCAQCQEIAEGTHPDVYELDAASRTGVENVREEIISRVQFAPTRGRFKVYIIDEVHMLSMAAFNALLKTLEEPPQHVVFIMCTTDPHKVPETIQSRCQRFDFRRLSIAEICSYLQRICQAEGFNAQPEALEFIAAKAAGGMRDATTGLEQVAVATDGNITLQAAQAQLGQTDSAALFELGGYIAARDAANSFLWLNRVVEQGTDLAQAAQDLAGHMRNLYVALLTGGVNGIVACPLSDVPRYQQQAAAFGGADRLNRAMTLCGDLVRELRGATNARLSFEVTLAKLCRAESELTLEALAERVESLEAGLPAPKLSGDLLSSMAQQAVASAAASAGMQGAASASVAAADAPQVAAEPVAAAAPEPEPEFEPEEEYVPEPTDDGQPWDDEPFAPTFAEPEFEAPQAEGAFAPEPEPLPQETTPAFAMENDAVDPTAAATAASMPWEDGAATAAAPAPTPEPAIGASGIDAPAAKPVAATQAGPAAQPAAAPAPAPNPAAAPVMSPARMMAAIHAAVKAEDIATDALLDGVEVEHDGAGYHLVFPAAGEFAMNLLQHGQANELLTRAFAKVAGVGVGFDMRKKADASASAAAAAPSFGSVSAVEAAAPVGVVDDGYLAAQDAYVDEYVDEEYDPYGVDDSVPAPAPVDEVPPSLDDAFDPAVYMQSRETPAMPDDAAPAPDFDAVAPMPEFNPQEQAPAPEGLADALSVFGGGIKFEEI